MLRFTLQLHKRIKKEQPQLVYITPNLSSWAFYRGCFMIHMLKRQGCSVIVHFHNKPPMEFAQKRLNQLLYKHFFRDVHAIFLADSLADTFREYLPSDHIHICPNGISEVTQPIPAKSTNQPYTFLFLSNMIERKGVIVLLEACAILKSRGYVFRCNFVGQWSDVTESRFNSICLELGISANVNAYGGAYGEQKNDLFRHADALVHPTLNDCFPLVVLEAMQHALPVISTHEGGIPSIIDEKVGLLCKQDDSNALADAMQYLLQNPDVGREMGKQGRLKFERDYTIHTFEQRFANILTTVLNKS